MELSISQRTGITSINWHIHTSSHCVHKSQFSYFNSINNHLRNVYLSNLATL
uniref:Uncharacterized protein n=1 Tax=Rhizophora mucronata TaxID=61149 RepID=A0A2P2P3J0_RHIMU